MTKQEFREISVDLREGMAPLLMFVPAMTVLSVAAFLISTALGIILLIIFVLACMSSCLNKE